MSKQRRLYFACAAFCLAAAIILMAAPVWADDCKGNCPGGSDSIVTVDSDSTITNSLHDSSRAYGLGLGDVDIAQCYRSWQVIIYQDSKPNWFCLADSLDAKGLHAAAAELRCSVNSYRKILGPNCVSLSTATPPSPPEPMPEGHLDDEREMHMEQMMLVEELRAKISELEAQQKRPARPVVRQEVIEKGGLTEEQKAQLREVVK